MTRPAAPRPLSPSQLRILQSLINQPGCELSPGTTWHETKTGHGRRARPRASPFFLRQHRVEFGGVRRRSQRLIENHHLGQVGHHVARVGQTKRFGHTAEALLDVPRVVRLMIKLREQLEEAVVVRLVAALERVPPKPSDRRASAPGRTRGRRSDGPRVAAHGTRRCWSPHPGWHPAVGSLPHWRQRG